MSPAVSGLEEGRRLGKASFKRVRVWASIAPASLGNIAKSADSTLGCRSRRQHASRRSARVCEGNTRAAGRGRGVQITTLAMRLLFAMALLARARQSMAVAFRLFVNIRYY